ncbi:hypothetical protein NL676_017841 [Syzygium grande]|nr:hypothetical protein NL676_017841 [Syzygium grande]
MHLVKIHTFVRTRKKERRGKRGLRDPWHTLYKFSANREGLEIVRHHFKPSVSSHTNDHAYLECDGLDMCGKDSITESLERASLFRHKSPLPRPSKKTPLLVFAFEKCNGMLRHL